MPSTINTGNIDTTFPIAGQDNDSQGFRDNFTNTNDNFIAAKNEIQDLQEKAILKSALVGDTVDNDMAGELIKNAQIQGFRGTVQSLGAVDGSVVIDVSDGPYVKLTTLGSLSLSFLNFSATGTHSAVRVEIDIVSASHTVTLPTEVVTGKDGLQNITGDVITFPGVGTYILEFGSSDNGSSLSVDDLTQSRLANRVLLSSVPATTQGAAGDLPGMIAYDGSFQYLCVAAFDGASAIWVRSPVATW